MSVYEINRQVIKKLHLIIIIRKVLIAVVTDDTEQNGVNHALYFESQSNTEIDTVPRREKANLFKGFGLVVLHLSFCSVCEYIK